MFFVCKRLCTIFVMPLHNNRHVCLHPSGQSTTTTSATTIKVVGEGMKTQCFGVSTAITLVYFARNIPVQAPD